MDQWLIALLSALLGGVVGAMASTVGAISVERAGMRRLSRVRQLRQLVPAVKEAVEAGLDELGARNGAVSLAPIVTALEGIEREAFVAGRRDARRAVHLVDLASEVWRLDRAVWGNPSVGRGSTLEPEEAIDVQSRMLVRVGGRIEAHELWLRTQLLTPWWRRQATT